MRSKDRVCHSATASLALLASVILAPPVAAAGGGVAAIERWLQRRVSELAADERLAGADVGVVVMDLASGRVIARHNEHTAVSIASNAKLFTSAAALSYLGPAFRFKTTMHARRIKGDQVVGDLFVKGHGDPSIREQTIWRMARDLSHAGVRRVTGGLTIDESYLDAQRLAPLFETRDTDAYYRPAVGALSLEQNVVWIGVRPAQRAGRPAVVVLSPRSAQLSVEGEVRTVGRRHRDRLQVRTEERDGATVVVVGGRVRRGGETRWRRKRVGDPGLYFATALRRQLRQQGIRLGRRAIRRARVPRRAKRILVHRSEPLGRVLRRMNKTSSNALAELVLKVLGAELYGRQGSTRLGLRAVREYLAQVGLEPPSYLLRNGSGLYDATRFSPRQVVQLLAHVYSRFRVGPEFVASLPIAGVDGTLARRFRGSGAEGYVRAKTGTLASVVALSGYAGASVGPPLAFSILLTGFPSDGIRRSRQVADELAQAMVTCLEQRALAERPRMGQPAAVPRR